MDYEDNDYDYERFLLLIKLHASKNYYDCVYPYCATNLSSFPIRIRHVSEICKCSTLVNAAYLLSEMLKY